MNYLVPPGSFVLVFDTDLCSFDLERELVAYATGRYGDCGFGSDESAEARKALPPQISAWLDEHVLSVPDEHGCARPAMDWSTPGWFNDGHGNHHRFDADEALVLERRNATILRNAEGIEGAYEDREIGEDRKAEFLAANGFDQPLTRYPARQSAAVAFDERPDGPLEALLRERAQAFCARENVGLTGHRLLRAGPQIYYDLSSGVAPLVPMDQEVHLETQISGKAFREFGPVELMHDGDVVAVRPTNDSRTVTGLLPYGLLYAAKQLALKSERFKLGLFALVEELLGTEGR